MYKEKMLHIKQWEKPTFIYNSKVVCNIFAISLDNHAKTLERYTQQIKTINVGGEMLPFLFDVLFLGVFLTLFSTSPLFQMSIVTQNLTILRSRAVRSLFYIEYFHIFIHLYTHYSDGTLPGAGAFFFNSKFLSQTSLCDQLSRLFVGIHIWFKQVWLNIGQQN